MKTFLCSAVIFILLLGQAWATTWAPAYPYVQKTEGGQVKVHSVPYTVRSGPNAVGETFVYAGGKLLYSMDRYFGGPILTLHQGEYLVKLNFELDTERGMTMVNEDGSYITPPVVYNGNAIQIYRHGKAFRSIYFSVLGIDTASVRKGYGRYFFAWNFSAPDSIEDAWQRKLSENSAYVMNDTLYLITTDDQLLAIDVVTGTIRATPHAASVLKTVRHWRPDGGKRKYEYVRYPEKFSLPTLESGQTIAEALAERNQKVVAEVGDDSISLRYYFHTLLVNAKGECEDVFVSPDMPMAGNLHYGALIDGIMKSEVEDWVKEQKFSVKTIPKGFRKYCYSDFVYLKDTYKGP